MVFNFVLVGVNNNNAKGHQEMSIRKQLFMLMAWGELEIKTDKDMFEGLISLLYCSWYLYKW